jgi:hypothetical protein
VKETPDTMLRMSTSISRRPGREIYRQRGTRIKKRLLREKIMLRLFFLVRYIEAKEGNE